MTLATRPLRAPDTDTTACLHQQVLDMEFLSRCGTPFLRRYHRAWIDSPHALALAVVDGSASGAIVGVLLGSLQPGAHYRAMVRRHGLVLALWLVLGAASHPSVARELVTTRLLRYLRGLGRVLRRSAPGPADARPAATTRAVGEVTHVMVHPDARSRGVGRTLMEDARTAAQAGGLDELVLVTPPQLAAGGFYEHLGWERVGQLTSRSGEVFDRYRLELGP